MTPLLEWLDILGVDEPWAGADGIFAGYMMLDGAGAMDGVEFYRHANCYELAANGMTLTVDRNPDGLRETGAIELVHDAG